MIHPLLKSNRIILTWAGIWVFIMITQFLTLFFSIDYPFGFSLADTIVSGIIYILISLGLWFTIRYGIQRRRNPLDIILTNILLWIATTTLWIALVWGILSVMNPAYSKLYQGTILSYRLVASLMFYICTVVVYYAINFYETLQEKQAQEMRLKTLVKEAQLNELRSQLHPHFLFNSLNSINSLTITNPAKAGEMIIKLSEFLRYSLSRKGHSMATFEKELYHIGLYLDIEKIRFGKRLEFNCEHENVSGEWPIPLMLLQPLIENAVKHGVYNTVETVAIMLHAKEEANHLVIQISNNFDPDAVPEKGTGTGLNNVRERLRLVYGQSSLFETHHGSDLFVATLKIPKIIQTE
jgi:two-component system, LytTR family, sensor kinase